MNCVAFIGLGNIGSGMAARQGLAGRRVKAFDLSSAAVDRAKLAGLETCESAGAAVSGADVVVTMLPAGPHVRRVYEEHVLLHAFALRSAGGLFDHRCRYRGRLRAWRPRRASASLMRLSQEERRRRRRVRWPSWWGVPRPSRCRGGALAYGEGCHSGR
jgi:hypothetical protein